MATLNLIQCDRCKTQAPRDDASEWRTYTATFAPIGCGPAPVEYSYDLCPGCRGKLVAAIGRTGTEAAAPAPLESIETIEQRHIMAVLTANDWNKSQASKILGIERSTLDRKLKKYDAARPVAVAVQ